MTQLRHLYSRHLPVIVLLSLVCTLARTQEPLSLQEAVALALKNNYAIGIASRNVEISSASNSMGNAGFLPSVRLQGSATSSRNNTDLEFNDGNTVSRDGAGFSVLNGGVVINWTIFDGLKMFATKDRLNEIEVQSKIGLKVEIENTILAISSVYYNIVRLQNLITGISEMISIYEQRIAIADMKFQVGAASKVDLLQARIDMNTQKALLLKYGSDLQGAQARLNQLMATDVDRTYKATDTLITTYVPKYVEMKAKLQSSNSALQFAKANISIADNVVDELNSVRLPQISLLSSYIYNLSNNDVGLVLLNRNLGLMFGVTASWTLFDGFKNSLAVQNAKIAAEQSRLAYLQSNAVLESDLLNQFTTYTNFMRILVLEEENTLLAKENVAIAIQGYETGKTSSLELLTAQDSYQESLTRTAIARYDVQVAEVALKKLEGTLVAPN